MRLTEQYPRDPKCPSCKSKMRHYYFGDRMDSYYCKNIKCEYCGINRTIIPWKDK